jgi:metal-responsive CopG/Arc/MetJ family transcriptional regulator
MGKYKGVNIPMQLFLDLKPYMALHSYRSFAELVTEALRLKLTEFKAMEQIEKTKGVEEK